jgi:hypothetical protein
MDLIKEAFNRIKQDIYSLQSELQDLRQEIKSLKVEKNSTDTPTFKPSTPLQEIQQTNTQTHPTHTPTKNMPLEELKSLNYVVSIGNEGVPTDKQTNTQTVRQTENSPFYAERKLMKSNSNLTTFDEAEEVISSLNTLKTQIKQKFKSLTPQEMLVFSTIYEFQDQNLEITYKTLAEHLKLSESSIRDYTNRLIKKDVPILKEKVNNKLIFLSIASNLRKNLSLSSIISLRDL